MTGDYTKDVITGAIVEVRDRGTHDGVSEVVVDGKVVATVARDELCELFGYMYDTDDD